MSKSGAAHWVRFFNTAGIPSPAAATYAHIFVENRIQSDMLMELNKEYLREMGIQPMGDIIAILRHAKSVNDQHARDRVLTTESTTATIPVAAVAASPIMQSSSKISLKPSSSGTKHLKRSSTAVQPLPKLPRRVLPEHEGKYKIKLPEGTTERSKQILAKRDKLYSDRVTSTKKSDVFKRLSKNNQHVVDKNIHDTVNDDHSDDEAIVSSSAGNLNDNNVRIQVTGLGNNSGIKRSFSTAGGSPTSSASVFARLGGKTTEVSVAKQIKPILKNAKRGSSGGITKAKTVIAAAQPLERQKQKVIMVSKVPVKRGDSDDEHNDIEFYDYNDDDMKVDKATTNEKFVKFASIAEVREIAPISNYRQDKSFDTGNIKARLGVVSKLHATKKTYNLKATPTKSRISPVKGKAIRMKSDELLTRQHLPVHQRLGNSGKTAKVQTQFKNNGNKGRRHMSFAGGTDIARRRNMSSVFDRLGFNS